MRYHITKAVPRSGYWHIEAFNKSLRTAIEIDISKCALLRYEKVSGSRGGAGASVSQPTKARSYNRCCNVRTWELYNGVTIKIDAKKRTISIT